MVKLAGILPSSVMDYNIKTEGLYPPVSLIRRACRSHASNLPISHKGLGLVPSITSTFSKRKLTPEQIKASPPPPQKKEADTCSVNQLPNSNHPENNKKMQTPRNPVIWQHQERHTKKRTPSTSHQRLRLSSLACKSSSIESAPTACATFPSVTVFVEVIPEGVSPS